MSKKRLHTISIILLTMEHAADRVNEAWSRRMSARDIELSPEELNDVGDRLRVCLSDCVVAFSARRDRAADDKNFRRCADNMWPVLDSLPPLGDGSAAPLLGLKEYVRTLGHEIVSAEESAERALDAVMDLRWVADAVEEVLYGKADTEATDDSFLAQPELLAAAPERLNDPSLDDGEKFFLSLFQTSLQAILIANDSLRIVAANNTALEMWGTELDELLEHPVPDIVAGGDRGALVSKLDSLQDGVFSELTATGKRIDGDTFPLVLTIGRVDLDDGNYFPITAHDVSETQELERELNQERAHVQEMAVTLKHVLRASADEKKKFQQQWAQEVETRVIPALGHIANESSRSVRKGYQTVLEDRLEDMTKGTENGLSGQFLKLTPTELEVCRMIRAGHTTKEISELLHSAHDTVQTHRKNIRRKLDLRGKKVSLYTFLNSKDVQM